VKLLFRRIFVAGIFCRVILAAGLIGNFWSVGHAASEAGKAVAVVQSATATGNNGKRTLKAGMPVSIGERIKTNSGGQVQLVFTDDTKLVVGPNSSLVIEAYLFRSKGTVNKFAVKALGGSFRFITGKSPKKAYSIKTPAATIGIRGTSFDLTVGRGGEADVVLFSGEAEVCGIGGCVQLKDYCSLASAPRKADVNLVRSKQQRDKRIRDRFPYIVSQAPLRRDFRVATRNCGDPKKAQVRNEPTITGSISPSAPAAAAEPEPEPEGNPGNAKNKGGSGEDPSGKGHEGPTGSKGKNK
jgi:hypothetical protein